MTTFGSALARNIRGFLADRRGTTAIEYAIMASGIALALVATMALVSDRVLALYETIVAAF